MPITDDELINMDMGSDEKHFKCYLCDKVRGRGNTELWLGW